jgi:hypothetical protein
MLLTERTRVVRVMNAVAAGTSNQNGTGVDMSQNGGFRGIRFTALFGALTGTQVTSLKAQESSDNSNWSDLAGSNTGPLADTDSNKSLILDVYRPQKQYIRPVVVRGTANAVIDGVTAELYEPITEPTSKDTSCSAQNQKISPLAGTA